MQLISRYKLIKCADKFFFYFYNGKGKPEKVK